MGSHDAVRWCPSGGSTRSPGGCRHFHRGASTGEREEGPSYKAQRMLMVPWAILGGHSHFMAKAGLEESEGGAGGNGGRRTFQDDRRWLG